MFEHLTLHGDQASILWGSRTAAVLSAWRIARGEDRKWYLTASITRADTYQLGRRPLLFAAPRARGFWAWGIEAIDVGPQYLRARLGPPEQ